MALRKADIVAVLLAFFIKFQSLHNQVPILQLLTDKINTLYEITTFRTPDRLWFNAHIVLVWRPQAKSFVWPDVVVDIVLPGQ